MRIRLAQLASTFSPGKLADAGFDAQQLSPLDIIPPVRRHGKLSHPERKARADLVASGRLDGLLGQRWKVETVNSVIL